MQSSGLNNWVNRERSSRVKVVLITGVVGLLLVGGQPVWADQTSDTLSQIEHMASLRGKKDRALSESIVEGIEKSPADISEALVLKLDGKDLTEHQIVVYVWALGHTKDQTAEKAILRLYKQNKSEIVRVNCLHAIASIGGKQAGNFLLSAFDAEVDRDKRFDILNLLGQMQFEAALPKTEEVLQLDPKEFYWKSIFVFGKMGDKAVPFLLERINHKDRNVRLNVINVLGRWLVPPESAVPLQNYFWEEKDGELRQMILGSLERTIDDPVQIETVFEGIVAKEEDKALVGFARETLGNLEQIKSTVVSFAEKKQHSPEAFQREYAQLFKTAGKKGNYEIIATSSGLDDEPKLKALRERILQRDSDESFYDYERVNNVIVLNRMIGKIANWKQAVRP